MRFHACCPPAGGKQRKAAFLNKYSTTARGKSKETPDSSGRKVHEGEGNSGSPRYRPAGRTGKEPRPKSFLPRGIQGLIARISQEEREDLENNETLCISVYNRATLLRMLRDSGDREAAVDTDRAETREAAL